MPSWRCWTPWPGPGQRPGEVALKLAALLRRSEAEDDGFLPEGEMALLRSALRDLRRLGRQKVAGPGLSRAPRRGR